MKKAFFSRRLLFKASLNKPTESDIGFAFGNPMAKSLKGSADLCNLQVDELLDLFGGIDSNEFKQLSLAQISKGILGNRKAVSKISSRASILRKKLIGHFNELHTDSESKDVALVDLGWNGTIQALLHKCLQLEGQDVNLHGYYLMTTRNAENYEVARKNTMYGFLVNFGYPEFDYNLISRNLEILEQACTPPHGSVIDYSDDFSPVVTNSLLKEKQLKDVAQIQEGILGYAKFYAANNPTYEELSDLDISYYRLKLMRAMLYPTRLEASLFDAWSHDDNLFTHEMKMLFDESCEMDVKSALISDIAQIPMTEIYWPAGAVAKADQRLAYVFFTGATNELDFSCLLPDLKVIEEAYLVLETNERKKLPPFRTSVNHNRFLTAEFEFDPTGSRCVSLEGFRGMYGGVVEDAYFLFSDGEKLIRQCAKSDIYVNQICDQNIVRTGDEFINGSDFLVINTSKIMTPQPRVKLKVVMKGLFKDASL